MRRHLPLSLLFLAAVGLSAADTIPSAETTPAAAANDVLRPLAGLWIPAGMVDCSDDTTETTRAPGMPPDMRVRIDADGLTMMMAQQEQKIRWRLLDTKPNGFGVEFTPLDRAEARPEHIRIVILNDGIAICREISPDMGIKLRRVDDGPVGLPPSVLPKAEALSPDAPLATRFTVTANNLSFDRTAHFQDDDIATASWNRNANLGLRLRWRSPIVCLGQDGAIVWQEIRTDTGESLVPPADNNRQKHSYSRSSWNPRETWVNASLSTPTRPAASITRMAGTIPVRCETKPGSVLEFSPIKDWIGKSKPLINDKGAITLVSCDGNNIRCRLPRDRDDMVREIEVLDASGAQLNLMNTHSMNGTLTGICDGSFPLDGTLRVHLTGETTVVQVPFSFSNIPLSKPATSP